MLTKTGQCSKCFAINSYQATNCIDCGAALPWAGGQPAPPIPGPGARAPVAPAPANAPAVPGAMQRPQPGSVTPVARTPVRSQTAPPPLAPHPGGGPFQQTTAPVQDTEQETVDEGWANNECVKLANAASNVLAGIPRPAEITYVHMTSEDLTWPEACACCLGPHEVNYEAALADPAARAPGAKVAGSHTWKVPFCRACLQHATLFNEAEHLASALSARADQALTEQAEVERVAHAGVLTKLLSVAHGSHGHHMDKLIAESRRDYHAFQSLMEQLSHIPTPSCCFKGPAVTYLKFHGEVHEFAFMHAAYANQFKQMNKEHILGWAGLHGR